MLDRLVTTQAFSRKVVDHRTSNVGFGLLSGNHGRSAKGNGRTKLMSCCQHLEGHHSTTTASYQTKAVLVDVVETVQEWQQRQRIVGVASTPLFGALATTHTTIVRGDTDVAPSSIQADRLHRSFGRQRTTWSASPSIEDHGW